MTIWKTFGAFAAVAMMTANLSAGEAAVAQAPKSQPAVQQVGWFTATQKPQVRCYRAPSRGNSSSSRSYGKSYGAHKPSSKPAWALQKTHPQKYSTRR